MKIYPTTSLAEITTGHPIFKYVENRFWNWIEGAPRDVKEMYFSEDVINDKKGAIIGAIENAIEYANEINAPVNLSSFDLEVAFE